jgi:hypothetical protein
VLSGGFRGFPGFPPSVLPGVPPQELPLTNRVKAIRHRVTAMPGDPICQEAIPSEVAHFDTIGCRLRSQGTRQKALYRLIGGTVPYAILGVEGCYSLQTLDNTMSDRLSIPRLILENRLTHFG